MNRADCRRCDGTDGYHNAGCPTGRILELPCPECDGITQHTARCIEMQRQARAQFPARDWVEA